MGLRKVVSLSLGLVVLAIGTVLLGTGSVGASPRVNPVLAATTSPVIPVNVTNTPLPVSGTVAANINGTPSVNVANAVSVAGSVGISNNPAVTLLNNNEITPVYVETEANPAYFVQQGSCSINTALNPSLNSQNNCTSFPNGNFGVTYRLAVQNTSIAVQVPLGTVVQNAYIGISAGTWVAPFNFLPLTKMSSDASSDYYVGTADVHLYLTTIQTLGCGITTSPNPSTGASTPLNIQCTISGHLVPGIAD